MKPRSWKYQLASHFADFVEKFSIVLYRLLVKFISAEKLDGFKPIPLCDLYIRLNRPIPQYLVGHAVYTIDQNSFRFRNDDGSETGATWIAAENVDWEVTSVPSDTNFRLRVMVQEIGGSTGTSDFTLQYSYGGAAYANVTTTSSHVQIRASSNFTDGATTTNLIGGTGTFDGGQMRETVTASSVTHSASGHSEHEWSLVLKTTYTIGTTVRFRLLRSGTPLSTNTRYPGIVGWTPINTIEDLDNIRLSNNGTSIIGQFRLQRDLDFNDPDSYANPAKMASFTTGLGFVPLGRISPAPWFNAKIDGNGHTISNLMINDTTSGQSNSGLLGVSDGFTVKNLGLINPRINANATDSNFNQCGALVMGIDPEGVCLVENCFVRGGVVVGGTGTGNNGTGGLIGISHEYAAGTVTIQNCYVDGTIVYRNGASPSSANGVGGLIGTANQLTASGGNAVNIIDCYSNAKYVDGDSTLYRGGLIGIETTSGTTTTSYYNSTTINYAGAGGTAKTDANMKVYSEFSSVFSIANGYANLTSQTWYMQSGDYPRLYYENYSPTVTNSIVSGSRTVASYYVDGSDVAVSDPNSHWATDSNLTNGTFNSYATNNGASGDGSVSTGYIEATGTNAPAGSTHIYQVRARFYSNHAITDNETAHLNVYSGSELLGYTSKGPIGGASYSDYVELKTPAGGWTWAKIQALRGRVWCHRMLNSGYVGIGIIDIEVTSETTPATGPTPILPVNGVDTEGNTIRYAVQVSTSARMDPYIDQQNYITTNVGGITADSATNVRRAQSFTTNSAGTLSSIMVRVGRTGTPVDNVTLKLYSDSANSPNTVLATASNTFVGADLSQNDIDSGNFTTLRFNFTGLSLTDATRYWISVERTGATSAINYYNTEGSSVTSFESESGKIYNGTSWAATGVLSLLFDVYMLNTQTTNTYISGTDAGFSGTPDNTDPYTSGQDVNHTIQTGLSAGTYYWRARGIDPTGHNIYGKWTGPSSFTVNTPPSVVLNSPADAGSTSDTTPTLEFTGTDPTSDDITYYIQVDTVNTFDSDIYPDMLDGGTVGTSFIQGETGGSEKQGQSFTPSRSYRLDKLAFMLHRTGTPTDGVYVELRSTSFSGTLIATSNTIPAASITATSTGTAVFNDFVFPTLPALTASTQYFAVIKRAGSRDTTNYWRVLVVTSNVYAGGNFASSSSGTWTDGSTDARFRVTADPPTLIGAISGIDSGFANITTPADTNPFNSGDLIGYTVQAGDTLANGTYYWRVKAKDSSGTELYGSWSGTRSFTVTGGAPQYTKTHTTDALKHTQLTRTHTTSSNKKKANTVSHTTSSNKKLTITKTHTTSSYLDEQVKNYSRANSVSIPTTENDLVTAYSSTDYTNVSTSNNVRVAITGPDYLLHQFKDKSPSTTQNINLSWEGQSTLDPSTSTVYLEVYNRVGGVWEVFDSNNSAPASTDFTLSVSISSNLSNYYDGSRWISARIRQESL